VKRSLIHRRFTRTAALLAAGLLALSACGSDDSGSSATVNEDEASASAAAAQKIVDEALKTPTSIVQDAPLGAAVPSGKKVVFLANAVSATIVIANGVEEATKAIGWDFEKVTYDIANPATLQSAMTTALQMKPDAVMVTGAAQSLFAKSVLEDYEEAGVPIVLGGSCPVEATGPVVAGPAECDGEAAVGRLVANWFIADSGGKGKALYANVTAYPAYVAYGDAFLAEVEEKCPGCSVKKIELTAAQVAENQVVPTAVNALRASPELKYAIFDNAAFVKGIEPALRAAGLTDIKVGGRQLDEGVLGALVKGDKGAWTASGYPLLGYGMVDAALRAILGTDGFEGNFIAPLQLVTAANAAEVEAPYNEPTDGLQQYLDLWKAQ